MSKRLFMLLRCKRNKTLLLRGVTVAVCAQAEEVSGLRAVTEDSGAEVEAEGCRGGAGDEEASEEGRK